MYTKESLNKAIQLMKAEKAFLESKNASDIAMCISNGNKKIGKVMNVSLPPILTCHNCKECKYFCYDIKACLQIPIPPCIINTVSGQIRICCHP